MPAKGNISSVINNLENSSSFQIIKILQHIKNADDGKRKRREGTKREKKF